MHPLESFVVVTAVATITILVTIEQHLRRNVNFWECVLPHDGDSIGKGTGGTESPTGSTPSGGKLVSHLGQVIDSIDISPTEILWKISIDLIWLPGVW
jgi:hypothetical protein